MLNVCSRFRIIGGSRPNRRCLINAFYPRGLLSADWIVAVYMTNIFFFVCSRNTKLLLSSWLNSFYVGWDVFGVFWLPVTSFHYLASNIFAVWCSDYKLVYWVHGSPPHFSLNGGVRLVCLPVLFSVSLEQLSGSFTENLYPRMETQCLEKPVLHQPAASPNTMLPHGFQKFFVRKLY